MCVCRQGEGLWGLSELRVGTLQASLLHLVLAVLLLTKECPAQTYTHTGGALISYYVLCSSVISRAPGLKLVVETLMSSLKPIGNIVVICCAFFIIFGILGVQVRGEERESADRNNEKTKRQSAV